MHQAGVFWPCFFLQNKETYDSDGLVPERSVEAGKYIYQGIVKHFTQITVTGEDAQHSDLPQNDQIIELIDRYVSISSTATVSFSLTIGITPHSNKLLNVFKAFFRLKGYSKTSCVNKISDIDGFFDKNPRKYADAKLFERITKIDETTLEAAFLRQCPFFPNQVPLFFLLYK